MGNLGCQTASHGIVALAFLLSGAACVQPVAVPAGPARSIDPACARLRLQEIQPAPRFPEGVQPASTDPPPAARRYLREARRFFDDLLWADAITQSERALQRDPQWVEPRLLLARAAVQQGNDGLAESHLQEILKLQPRCAAAHRLLGEIALRQGKTADAVPALRLALMAADEQSDPTQQVLAHHALSLALRDEGYLQAAVDQLQAYLDGVRRPALAIEQYHELAETMVLYRGKAAAILGEIQTQLGHTSEAVAAYERAAAESPDDVEIKAALARALARAGRDADALDAAHALLATASGRGDRSKTGSTALSLLREICDLIGKPRRYDRELARLILAAEDPVLRIDAAKQLADRGNPGQAADVLEQAGAGHNLEPDELHLLARLRRQLGDLDACLRTLADALRRRPASYAKAKDVLDPAKAPDDSRSLVEHAARLAEQNPDDAVARYLHGLTLSLAGQLDSAREAFEEAVRIGPDFGPTHAALAEAHIQAKRWQDAVDAAQTAIDTGLRDANIYTLKGRAHDALDDYEHADAAFLEAFNLDRGSPLALFEIAQSLERRADQRRRCEQLYRRILGDVDPRFIPAREKLVRLYLNTGRIDKARQYYEDFKRLELTGPAVERCTALLNLAADREAGGRKRLEAYQDELRAISARYPDDVSTYIDLAMSYFATGRNEDALAPTEAALRIAPGDLRAREIKAKIKARLLAFEEAADILTGLLAERPKNVGWQRQLVELAFYRADYAKAAGILRALIEREDLGQKRALFVDQLLEAFTADERFDEAVGFAKDWLDQAPDDPMRRDRWLATLQNADRHDEAVRAAARYLADDPTNTALRRRTVGQLEAAGRLVEAQQRVLSWLANDPDDIELNRMLILLLWSARQWDDAIEVAQIGAESAEHRPIYDNWLGQSYVFAERYDEAVEFYRRRARAFESGFRDLISVLIRAERFEEARQNVEQLLEPQLARQQAGQPHDPALIVTLRRYLSRIYQLTDRPTPATQQLEEIFKMLPDDAGTNNDLGYTWADAGVNLDRAEKMIRLAVGEEPRSAAYLDSLGWVLYKQGKFDEAVHWLDLTLKQATSEDPVMHDHHGDALYRLGKTAEARQAWERALELSDPDDKPPPSVEDRRLHDRIKEKLERLAEDKTVPVAPIAGE